MQLQPSTLRESSLPVPSMASLSRVFFMSSSVVLHLDMPISNTTLRHLHMYKFCKILKIIRRHSTLMISNDTQSQSEHSISQYY